MQAFATTETAMFINDVRLPLRKITLQHEGETLELKVPRGIARNNRNKSWQIKVARGGEIVIKGNISDGENTPQESLAHAITMIRGAIEANEGLSTLKSKGRGGRIEPYRVNDYVTLHWKVVNTTPNMYALIYSPLLKKPKTVNIGSEKKVADYTSFSERLALALTYGKRVYEEKIDPFGPISPEELKVIRPLAMDFLKSSCRSSKWLDFVNACDSLRATAEATRAVNMRANGINSPLALKVLSSVKGRLA